MIGDLKEILGQLNSKSDWAVVGGAAFLGFVTDAAIDIVPLPIFSPGVCGVAAAGAALSAKRGWEAVGQSRRDKNALNSYRWEAQRIASRLEDKGEDAMAEWLRFQVIVAESENDSSILRNAIDKAINLL